MVFKIGSGGTGRLFGRMRETTLSVTRTVAARWNCRAVKWKKRAIARFSAYGRVAAVPAAIADLSESLVAACREAEPEFIRLGNIIQALYGETAALSAQTRDLAAGIGGETEDAAVARVGRAITKSLGKLEHCRLLAAARLERFAGMTDRLGKLHRITAEIEKTGTFLKVAGFNIGIESARSIAAWEMFKVVSRDILQLSGNIIEMAAAIRADSEATLERHETARAMILDDQRRLDRLVAEGRDAVESAFREIEQLMAVSLGILENAAEQSRKVAAAVGEVVMGIQFHDNLSQRVAHIVKALADAAGLCGAVGTRGAAHSILCLQSAQLRRAVSEIAGVYQRNHAAIGQIGAEITLIAQRLSGLESAGDPATRDQKPEEPFRCLRTEFVRLNGFLRQGHALADRVSALVDEIFQVTRRLSGYAATVRGIGYETHIKALNAIVNAAHLGDAGKTLEVLAQHIKDASDHTDRFVEETAAIIESVSAGGSAEDARASENADLSGQTADRVIDAFAREYERFAAASTEAVDRSEALMRAVENARATLEFLPALEERLSDLSGRLDDIGRMLAPWADGGKEATAHLADRYTTDEERSVHAAMALPRTGEAIAPDTGQSAPSPADDEHRDDDLGDNVELF